MGKKYCSQTYFLYQVLSLGFQSAVVDFSTLSQNATENYWGLATAMHKWDENIIVENIIVLGVWGWHIVALCTFTVHG